MTSTVAMLLCASPARTKSIFPSSMAIFPLAAYAAWGKVSPEYPCGAGFSSSKGGGVGIACVGNVWEKENKVGDIERERRRVCEYDGRG